MAVSPAEVTNNNELYSMLFLSSLVTSPFGMDPCFTIHIYMFAVPWLCMCTGSSADAQISYGHGGTHYACRASTCHRSPVPGCLAVFGA